MTRTSSPADASPTRASFDVQRIRKDFPILHRRVQNDKPLVYLDNAATTQKPQTVIDAVADFYRQHNANVHRGLHTLSMEATECYESVRQTVADFLNAESRDEIVYVRGVTEAVNLVADSFGQLHIHRDDEILITQMEHHANIVPWQLLCERTGAQLRVAPINERGELIFEELEKLLTERTKIVSVVHVSNALGTINPVKRIVDMAHRVGATVMIDGAQASAHLPIDVRDLDCDFYAFSGHKVFAPTGIGALYGKRRHLATMPPYQGGGEMIESVTFEKTTFKKPPARFEAGTPNIAGVVGLGAALTYVQQIDAVAAAKHEQQLLQHGAEALKQIKGLRLIGEAKEKTGVLSFVIDGVHPHDIATVLDTHGVAVRAGHHCAQPIMAHFGVPATARASLALYNTQTELDELVAALQHAVTLFA